MSLADLSAQLTQAFQSRGLQLDRFTVPGDLLAFVCPHGWTASWKEDHVSVTHGVPPQGWLTLYPVSLRESITAGVLLGAFLDEFVAPAADQLEMIAIRHLERLPELELANFKLTLAGKRYEGLAIARVSPQLGQVISYWTDEAMFRLPLIEDLLVAVLGSIEVPESSPFSPKQARFDPIPAHAVWREHPLELKTSFASQAGRFALRLPEGWQGLEVTYEGDVGWLLLPPGVSPNDENAPLISISGADLLASLDETLEEAIANLTDDGLYTLEHPATELEVKEQQGLAQLRLAQPPSRPGQAFRLWSLGMTDGISIVHLFAVAEANRMLELLPGLNAISRSLRVLPRVPNRELMQRMEGYWRFLDSQESDKEALEHTLHLRADGTYGAAQRSIAPRASITDRPIAEQVTGGRQDGLWEIVDSTLSLNRADGTREIFEIESLSERSAIVGKTFWERL